MSTKYDTASVPAGVIFVAADEPLLVFCSIRDAENFIEPVDVEDGVYPIAYGPCGEPHRVALDDQGTLIEPTGESARPDELKGLLLRYFEACDDPADADEPLDELVARAWAIECGYRRRCGSDDDIERRKMPIWGYLAIIAIPALILFLALRYR